MNLASIESTDLVTDVIENPRPPLATGDVVAGRFELVEELPPGGSAIVFVALDRDAGSEKVVVKLGRLSRAIDTSLLDQYRKMRSLRSTNVVTCLGYFRHDDVPVIALEHIEGATFAEYSKTASVADNLEMMRQLARGLDEIAVVGLRHGDLTGRNVLVRDGKIVLIDPDANNIPSVPFHSNDDYSNFLRLADNSGALAGRPGELERLRAFASLPRPFLAAAGMLKTVAESAAPFAPSPARRAAMREAYGHRVSKEAGEYQDLVRQRNDFFDEVAQKVQELATLVGFPHEPIDERDHEVRRREQMGGSLDRGVLHQRRRAFKVGARRWALSCYGAQEFPKPSPWGNGTVAQWSSVVDVADGSTLTSENYRVRLGKRFELQTSPTPTTWSPAPPDWMERSAEILIGERVPGLVSPDTLAGDADPAQIGEDIAMNSSGEIDRIATVEGLSNLEQKLHRHMALRRGTWVARPNFGTVLFGLVEAPEAQAQLQIVDSFNRDFKEPYGKFFRSCQRYDLVRIDGSWYLEIHAVAATVDTETVAWRIPLPWLKTSW